MVELRLIEGKRNKNQTMPHYKNEFINAVESMPIELIETKDYFSTRWFIEKVGEDRVIGTDIIDFFWN